MENNAPRTYVLGYDCGALRALDWAAAPATFLDSVGIPNQLPVAGCQQPQIPRLRSSADAGLAPLGITNNSY